MSSTRLQLHFILLLLAYYCPTYIAANSSNGSTVKCLPDQASSLLQLKHSFHNPNLSSWQHGTDCCHWEGVGCDRASGQVITLDLSYRNLQSTSVLSPVLFNLTSLSSLSLAGNDFNFASLPNFGFEKLTNLLSLDLYHTRMAGQIPIGISHLKNLRTLDLSYNHELYFREPSFQMVVRNLSNLMELYLDGVGIISDGKTWSSSLANSVPRLKYLSLNLCGLSGHIHSSFSRLQSLESITLSQNSISGKVPEFFSNFFSLSTLDLFENDFEGQFPTKIFQLKKLRFIDLFSNIRLSGQLPNFPVENSLEVLDLTGTNFTVSIPKSFVNLKFLTFLGLRMVDVTEDDISLISKLTRLQSLVLFGSGSEKPNFSWIGNLERLMNLELVGYNFSSSIPSWIGNLTGLTILSLEDCGLYGRIPMWMGNLTTLSELHMVGNNLQGEIPKYLLDLPNLEILFLGQNQLSGHLEDISAPLTSPLTSIGLDSNQLSGPIPKSFFQLARIERIQLNSNKLVGTVELSLLSGLKYLDMLVLSDNMLSVIDGEGDYQVPPLPNMHNLYLSFCNLTKIPSILRYQHKMSDVDLSRNNIDGVIPCWMWENGKDSVRFNLSHNIFTSLEKCTPLNPTMRGLGYIDLSSNRLEGNLPIPLISGSAISVLLDYSNNSLSSITPAEDIHANISIYLNLSKNKLNGHIPNLVCGANYEMLDFSHNNLTGPVPACLIQHGNVKMLKLRGNQLHGMLPENIGQGCMFQTIDLNNNQIEGKVPRSLSNCRSLEVLDIGNNQIIDSFPTWLGDISNLRILILRSNQFYGSIIGGPTESDAKSKHFSGLQIIDLASNNFSGSLNSKWFGKLETMKANSSGEGNALALKGMPGYPGYYYQESLTFKGIDFTFTKILSTFKMIDFSNNAFDGLIPESIGKLIALHGLNMSHNAFTGGIPSMLGGLAQLESLDLCRNKLSGGIPQELTFITYLAVLNLSYNDLTGMIPQGPQFSLFANSSFEGNQGLCGRPLSKQCNNLGTGTLDSSVSSKDSVGTILLFVFVGSGFGVGFAVAVVLSVVWLAKWWNCNCFMFGRG
ncbi:receptor-like protein 7 [Lolium rigidum]|uniref:receptor-like protein 7 n=1 Tax=Lolium rigidum TaxID=89674 RepID=UPI001F5E2A84|nr:receptor-like protein 7 [Lolium rigidum]